MRRSESLLPVAATTVTGFFCVASIFLSPNLAEATEARPRQQPPSQQHRPKQQQQAGQQAAPPQSPAQPSAKALPAPTAPKSLPEQNTGAACTCPEQRTSPWARPKYARLPGSLDENDHIAALESVQFALNEVGDGGTYTWELTNGHISGAVQPTTSFKDGNGQVCRHLIVLLNAGERSSKTEGVACRMPDGRWQLEG